MWSEILYKELKESDIMMYLLRVEGLYRKWSKHNRMDTYTYDKKYKVRFVITSLILYYEVRKKMFAISS